MEPRPNNHRHVIGSPLLVLRIPIFFIDAKELFNPAAVITLTS